MSIECSSNPLMKTSGHSSIGSSFLSSYSAIMEAFDTVQTHLDKKLKDIERQIAGLKLKSQCFEVEDKAINAQIDSLEERINQGEKDFLGKLSFWDRHRIFPIQREIYSIPIDLQIFNMEIEQKISKLQKYKELGAKILKKKR